MPPLSHVRVLDFTRHLPGPYATDLLCRLGAEVIKIEPPDGDPTRWFPPLRDGVGTLFPLVNSGKKSAVVDLKSAEGRDFVHRLARKCDVSMESYKPGVAATFGVDGETLRGINPRLVHCSISGYGAGSPRSSHDLNFVAMSGLLDLQRDPAGTPMLPATQIGDISGALFAAVTILGALLERERTGSGRSLDISMADATRAVMPTAEAFYLSTHETPSKFLLTGSLPSYSVFRTSDGGHLSVGALEPQFWARFCSAIGHPELADRERGEAATEATRKTIEDAIGSRTRAEWEQVFAEVDACVEPVLTIAESHARFGDPMQRHPIETNFPSATTAAAPLGGDFAEVAKIAGIGEEEAARLLSSGRFTAKRR